MVRVERRLAHHQYQLASLLQVHVRGAHDEVVIERVRDRRHGAHAAGRHQHARGQEGAAREGRGQILLVVHDVGHSDDVVIAAVRLVRDRRLRAGRHDRVQLDRAVLADHLEGADPVDRARRARQRDDDAARCAHARRRCVRTRRGFGNVAAC